LTAEQKKKLQQKLWDIANELRGKMAADQFRDYILGLIFYKYLSERMQAHANRILKSRSLSFTDIVGHDEEGELRKAVAKSSLNQVGYYLSPEELFSELASRGAQDEFILSDLERVLNHIQDSTMGTESEQDFVGLFEDVDLGHPKLGRTEQQKNELIAKVIVHLQQLDFGMNGDDNHPNEELLGDAYEYLIGQFASGAGKKAGEFYTPASVSTVLAKIVTLGKDSVSSVYDPTCGSASLMLRVAREVTGDTRPKFYGQEMNRTTFNLARMNMLLHGIHFSDFDIRQEDTLTRPAAEHEDMCFEAIVANPPFSAKWSAHEIFNTDDRFSQYGRLAPKSRADFAFVQHMLNSLNDNGTMAVVLPHGVLYRDKSEEQIRKYIVESRNWIDAVIGLPKNLFFGTTIPACIVIFKKCRENDESILFIDASKEFSKGKKKNSLLNEHIKKIVQTYEGRLVEVGYSDVVSMAKIEQNDYNLNISRYVNSFEPDKIVRIKSVIKNSEKIAAEERNIDKEIANLAQQIALEIPQSKNTEIWRVFKDGVVNELLNKKLRFKQKDGKHFPDWKPTPISKIGKFVKGKGVGKADINENGKFPCIRYGELYTSYGQVIDAVRSATNVEMNRAIRSTGNDVLIPSSGETAIDIARASAIVIPQVILGGDLNVLRTKQDARFIAYTLSYNHKIELARLAQGNSVVHLYGKHMRSVIVSLPDIREQKIIADFIHFIDRKIDLTLGKLENISLSEDREFMDMFG